MKTLIFNGSPRKNGDTAVLINEFTSNLEGEYKIINSYDCNIKACIDCRYCWKNEGCSQIDGMQEVYSYIQECDNILIASPIFFTEISGQLLAVASRLQTYFCARYFRKETPIKKSKKGGIILAAGGNGNMEKAFSTASMLLDNMNAKEIGPAVYCLNTDQISPKNNIQDMKGVREIAKFFNQFFPIKNKEVKYEL